MAKNMVKNKSAKMTAGAGGGAGRLEKSMAVPGKTPGKMGVNVNNMGKPQGVLGMKNMNNAGKPKGNLGSTRMNNIGKGK